jgi:tellurite resistance protein TerC
VLFGLTIWWALGGPSAGAYFSCLALEELLSLDNVIAWGAVFALFLTPPALRKQALLWGLVGAFVLRAAAIFGGAALLQRAQVLVFGLSALLIVAGVRQLRDRSATEARAVSWLRRTVPTTSDYVGRRLVTRVDGRWMVTPLLIAIIAVDLVDLVFAVDSIPASLAVTQSTFLVISANTFAIIALRELYVAVDGLRPHTRQADRVVGVLLIAVGVEAAVGEFVHLAWFVLPALILAALVLGGGMTLGHRLRHGGPSHRRVTPD